MKKSFKIISIAILCWVVLFALATYAGPAYKNDIKGGTILEIKDWGLGGQMKIAVVVDNTGHNYNVLLIPVNLPNAVYSNVGDKIIFKLMRAAGNNNEHEGMQIHKALKMQ